MKSIRVKQLLLGAAIGVAGAVMGSSAVAAEISGAGASFPYPVYSKWAAAYHKETGNQVNYQSIGSGGGIKQIKAKTVDFGASDAPLTPDELKEAGLMQWPMVMGGVVPVVNVPGIKGGDLRLSNELMARIFMGDVSNWNDPAIAKLNPNVDLPDSKITVVHRSDGSGTTFIFTDYLSKVSDGWKSDIGRGKVVDWPVGVGGKGNEGVASYVDRIKGSIGYVEYAYAVENKLAYAQLRNRDGNWVNPEASAFSAAAAGADWEHADGMYLILTDQPGAKSWPITAATFILMHKKQDDPQTAKNVLDFFSWAFANGDQMAADLHYVPMPQSVVKLIKSKWSNEIHAKDGSAIWKQSM